MPDERTAAEIATEYFFRVGYDEQIDLIRALEVPADLPFLSKQDDYRGEVHKLLSRYLDKILPHLLRRFDLSNEEVRAFVRDGAVSKREPSYGHVFLSFQLGSGLQLLQRESHPDSNEVSIGELAAAAAGTSELFDGIMGAAVVFGEPDVSWPKVRVTEGSVQFSIGGSTLLTGGVALVIATSSLLGLVGGAVLLSAGLFDLILGWKKQVAETDEIKAKAEKEREETQKLQREAAVDLRNKELDQAKKELEAQNIRQEQSPPAAGQLPAKELFELARTCGVDPAYAAFVLNRTLTRAIALKAYYPTMSVSRPRAASGGAGR